MKNGMEELDNPGLLEQETSNLAETLANITEADRGKPRGCDDSAWQEEDD